MSSTRPETCKFRGLSCSWENEIPSKLGSLKKFRKAKNEMITEIGADQKLLLKILLHWKIFEKDREVRVIHGSFYVKNCK